MPDGRRVAVLTAVESARAPRQEHEVVFLSELRRRAAAACAVGEMTSPSRISHDGVDVIACP